MNLPILFIFVSFRICLVSLLSHVFQNTLLPFVGVSPLFLWKLALRDSVHPSTPTIFLLHPVIPRWTLSRAFLQFLNLSLEVHAVFFLSCAPFFVSPIKKLLSNLFTTSSTPFSLFVLPFFSLQCSLQPVLDSFSPRSNNLLPVFLSPWSSFPPLSFSSVRAAFLRYGTIRQSRAAGGTEKRRP